MNDIIYNGKYWFYLDEDKDVAIIPIPGDVIVKKDGSMHLVANVLFLEKDSKLDLDVMIFSNKDLVTGRQGLLKLVMTAKNIDFSKEKLKSYTILRGCTKLYPISLKFKIFNFCVIIKHYIKNFLKKN